MSLENILEGFSSEADALVRLNLTIFKLNGLFLDIGNEMFAPIGMTHARSQVIGAIDIAGTPLTAAQIARNMGLTRQSVQRTINILVDDGLLTLENNPDHKRASLVKITPAGEKKITQIRELLHQWSERIALNFDTEALEQGLGLLESLTDHLEQVPPTTTNNRGQ
ncbi:MAG: MarR family transcriptional regulator [Gammaproteobacteria bacterium]|nr:MarR family transcriptional regulator [Gammaproteobacteria bacterium]